MGTLAPITPIRGVAAPAPAAAAMTVDPGTPITAGPLVPGRGPRGVTAVQARMEKMVHPVKFQVRCHLSHLLLQQEGMMTKGLAARVTVLCLGLDMQEDQ